MKQSLLAVAALSAALATSPVLAQGPARRELPPSPPAEAAPATTAEPVADPAVRRQEIEAAIAAQTRRKSGARASFIIAGVALAGGVILSAVKTAENQEEAEQEAYENGESEYSYDTDMGGVAIGALIAVPLIISGVTTLVDANRRLKVLNRQRYTLGLAPGPDGSTLALLRIGF